MCPAGVGTRLGSNLLAAFRWMGPQFGPLTAVYVATTVLTAILSNGAAVTIMYSIVRSIASETSLPLKALLYIMMVGGSSVFCTPIGYQTNLMVSGPGGYKFADFVRFGLPLQVVTMVVAVVMSYFAYGMPG